MSAAYFDITDPEIASIMHKAHIDHSKFFVAQYYRINLLFQISNSGDLLIFLRQCR